MVFAKQAVEGCCFFCSRVSLNASAGKEKIEEKWEKQLADRMFLIISVLRCKPQKYVGTFHSDTIFILSPVAREAERGDGRN